MNSANANEIIPPKAKYCQIQYSFNMISHTLTAQTGPDILFTESLIFSLLKDNRFLPNDHKIVKVRLVCALIS
ncbi:MAG: hypothetical protein ACOZBL_05690 [Patescibacteria group bacterium]